MPKDIIARVGTYEKDGETKGRYVKLGVLCENDNGEYVLIEATNDLGAILVLQRLDAHVNKKKPGNSILGAVVDDRDDSDDVEDDDDDDLPY